MSAILELRQYQEQSIKALRAGVVNGHSKQVLSLPTGGGKTESAIHLTQEALQKGSSIVILVDRINLVDQWESKLQHYGVDCGIFQGERADIWSRVLICSQQTVERRPHLPIADLYVIDECHSQRRIITDRIRKLSSDKAVVGLTATPMARGMGRTYSNLITGITTDYLIKHKYLVPLRVMRAKPINTAGLSVQKNGEWSDSELTSRALPVVGDVVKEWIKHTKSCFGGAVPTLIFAVNTRHGDELVQQFARVGYRFEQVSYRDSPEAKGEKIDKLERGHVHGLISCEALIKGVDLPLVRCLVVARPYRKSLTSHIQMIGRAMRSDKATDKRYALLLDHADNYSRFDVQTQIFMRDGIADFTDGELLETRYKYEKQEQVEQESLTCRSCQTLLSPNVRVCMYCGTPVYKKKSKHARVKGKLVEFETQALHKQFDVWPHISAIALKLAKHDESRALKFALAQYKQMTGYFPQRGISLNPTTHVDSRVADLVHEQTLQYRNKQKKRKTKALTHRTAPAWDTR